MIAEPAGATWTGDGWNFASYSRHATEVTLLSYGQSEFVKPLAVLNLDPLQNKTGRIWHCFVPHMAGARYYPLPGRRPDRSNAPGNVSQERTLS